MYETLRSGRGGGEGDRKRGIRNDVDGVCGVLESGGHAFARTHTHTQTQTHTHAHTHTRTHSP